ncbi:MAG: hypothetical protein E7656_06905 [Ruminococcaceae bacterium]|nr:hypothetical protein [Oscillospiraceae bacterium]
MKKLVWVIINILTTVCAIALIAFFAWLYTVLGTGALFIIFSITLYGLGAVILVLLVVRMIEWFAKKSKDK